jgi:hypothetical protein
MTFSKYFNKLSFCLLALMTIVLFLPQTALCQTEKLGIVGYTAPKDWTKTKKENIVAFSEINQATGAFCIITLYGATPGTGNAEKDFKREWKNLLVEPFKAEPNPETETESEAGWTAISGGTSIEYEGIKSAAFLTVISGGGKAISILSVFNNASYAAQVAAFTRKIELGKASAETSTPQRDEPVTPETSSVFAEMSAAGLVGEFESNEIRANQTYIGKRVRIRGIVNIIEINKTGQVVVTFKSSIGTTRNARCYFNKSESSRVADLSAHTEATVEGIVRGMGDGFDNSKAYIVLENCIVP